MKLFVSTMCPDSKCNSFCFRNAGQTCVSTNRLLVQETVHDEFVAKLKAAIEKDLVLGDGFQKGVNQVDAPIDWIPD